MNIAMVSPYSWAHPGGVNNHITGLASQMSKRGHSVSVVAPDHGEAPEGARLVSAGRSIPVLANGSVSRLALLPGAGKRVKREIGRGDYDVVHVHEPLVPLVSTSAVTGARSRVVGTFHAAAEGRSLTYLLGRFLFGRVDRRLDSRIAVSKSAESVASRYFPGDYHLVPNGVDLNLFSPKHQRPEEFPEGVPVVLFVGRDEPRKGLSVLLEAFERLSHEVPECHLVLVGPRLNEKRLTGKLSPAVASRIKASGFVSNRELAGFYRAADVFCAPALGGESFGVVLIEAMACGTPVVASDIPGYRDVLESTGGGLLFERASVEGLSEALKRVLNDARLRERLTSRALAGVTRFSWDNLAERIESIYRGAI